MPWFHGQRTHSWTDSTGILEPVSEWKNRAEPLHAVLEEVSCFVDRAQLSQCFKGKRMPNLLSHNPADESRQLYKNKWTIWREETILLDSLDKWVRSPSDENLKQPEMEFLAKGLHFAISYPQLSAVHLIAATESAIRSNILPEAEAELASAKMLSSNLSFREKQSISKDQSIATLPAEKIAMHSVPEHSQLPSHNTDSTQWQQHIQDPGVRPNKHLQKEGRRLPLAVGKGERHRPPIILPSLPRGIYPLNMWTSKDTQRSPAQPH